jgi:hypothetical protein
VHKRRGGLDGANHPHFRNDAPQLFRGAKSSRNPKPSNDLQLYPAIAAALLVTTKVNNNESC